MRTQFVTRTCHKYSHDKIMAFQDFSFLCPVLFYFTSKKKRSQASHLKWENLEACFFFSKISQLFEMRHDSNVLKTNSARVGVASHLQEQMKLSPRVIE